MSLNLTISIRFLLGQHAATFSCQIDNFFKFYIGENAVALPKQIIKAVQVVYSCTAFLFNSLPPDAIWN